MAGITYRQLDYWARKGWITPSRLDTISPGRKVRGYTRLDVARLAALRHLARSGHDVALYGTTVGMLELLPDVLVVAGQPENGLQLVHVDELLDIVGKEATWTVFDPTPYLTSDGVGDVVNSVDENLTRINRRTA